MYITARPLSRKRMIGTKVLGRLSTIATFPNISPRLQYFVHSICLIPPKLIFIGCLYSIICNPKAVAVATLIHTIFAPLSSIVPEMSDP